MPLYEYRCPKCEFKFELLRPMSQVDEEASCPRCNNGARRILSSFAAFSKSSSGDSTPVGGDNACGACSATSCSTCH